VSQPIALLSTVANLTKVIFAIAKQSLLDHGFHMEVLLSHGLSTVNKESYNINTVL